MVRANSPGPEQQGDKANFSRIPDLPKFLRDNKPLRQYILGHLNPGHQQQQALYVHVHFVASIQRALLATGSRFGMDDPQRFVAFQHDELVITIPDAALAFVRALHDFVSGVASVVRNVCSFVRLRMLSPGATGQQTLLCQGILSSAGPARC